MHNNGIKKTEKHTNVCSLFKRHLILPLKVDNKKEFGLSAKSNKSYFLYS